MTFNIHIDWANDGTFSTSTGRDHVTADIRGEEGITVSRGRDEARILSPTRSGELRFSLNSHDTGNQYWPSTTGISVVPGRPVRARWISGSTVDLFTGNVEEWEFHPEFESQSVGVIALDGLERFTQTNLSTPVSTGIVTSEAITTILDEMGWSTSARTIDPGQTSIPYWWAEDKDALTAVEELVTAEGPGAAAYVDGSGHFHFESRHFRLIESRSVNSQSTWSAKTEPRFTNPLEYRYGKRDIINEVTVDVTRYEVQPSTEIWTLGFDSLSIPSGSTRQIKVEPGPFIGGITPTTDDYTVAFGSIDSVSLDRDSGETATISVVASTTGDALLSSLRLRGQALQAADTVAAVASDTGSQDTYGLQTWPLSTPWIASQNLAQDFADAVLERYKEPTKRLGVTFLSATTEREDQQANRQVSDRITMDEARSGLAEDFWVETIDHAVIDGGKLWRTTFNVEETVAGLVGSSEVFILDSTSQGILGTNKLGY